MSCRWALGAYNGGPAIYIGTNGCYSDDRFNSRSSWTKAEASCEVLWTLGVCTNTRTPNLWQSSHVRWWSCREPSAKVGRRAHVVMPTLSHPKSPSASVSALAADGRWDRRSAFILEMMLVIISATALFRLRRAVRDGNKRQRRCE